MKNKIKTEDLRIGNLVLVNGNVITVDSVNGYGINLECQTGRYGGMDYDASFEKSWSNTIIEPIPLDEQWLYKLGFINGEESLYPRYYKKYIHRVVDCVIEIQQIDEKMYTWIEGNTIVDIYNVHDLQNLWYQITKTELTIKD